MRFACLFVPLFPLAARLRSEPDLSGEAVAVFDGNGNAARLVGATRRARKAGLRVGMSPSQTRSLLTDLTVRNRDQESEYAAQQSLLEIAEGFSPRVEDAEDGIVFLTLDGLDRLWNQNGCPENDIAHAIALDGQRENLAVWVGIASSKLASRIAAEQPSSPTIVPDGEESGFLAPLPLTRLSSELEIIERLRRWGIRSIGDFAKLPRNEVSSRLGSVGRKLHRKARGLDRRPLIPYQPPPTFQEGMDLEWPLTSLEPFLFVSRAALDRICSRLERRGLACTRLELEARLDPDGHHHRSIQLPAPTRDTKTLATLIQLDLENHSPDAPIAGFTFTAHPDRPREAQLSLFGPIALSPDKLATTLARLFSILGPDRMGTPGAVDDHKPESCALVDYSPPPPPKVRPEPEAGKGLLAVRVLRPPLPVEVLVSQNGPHEIQSTVCEEGSRRPRIDGGVKVASGPWRLDADWWLQNEEVDREYWDVELSNGGIYRIFRDRRSGDWFADGIYD